MHAVAVAVYPALHSHAPLTRCGACAGHETQFVADPRHSTQLGTHGRQIGCQEASSSANWPGGHTARGGGGETVQVAAEEVLLLLLLLLLLLPLL